MKLVLMTYYLEILAYKILQWQNFIEISEFLFNKLFDNFWLLSVLITLYIYTKYMYHLLYICVFIYKFEWIYRVTTTNIESFSYFIGFLSIPELDLWWTSSLRLQWRIEMFRYLDFFNFQAFLWAFKVELISHNVRCLIHRCVLPSE